MADAKALRDQLAVGLRTMAPDLLTLDGARSMVDRMLAAGVTLPEPAPPAPPGPVTSEEAVVAYEVAYNARSGGFLWFDPAWRIEGRHAFDAIRDRYARDHGLLTPAEVERRARAWADDYNLGPAHESALVAALTAPADTSAASTREAK